MRDDVIRSIFACLKKRAAVKLCLEKDNISYVLIWGGFYEENLSLQLSVPERFKSTS